VDTFLAAELLPLAESVPAAVRDRIAAEARATLAPFVAADGSIAAPLEVQLITESAGRTRARPGRLISARPRSGQG
jgi:hypothetical protein